MGGFQRSGDGTFSDGRVAARFEPGGLVAGGVPVRPTVVLRTDDGDLEIAATDHRTTIDDGLLVRVVAEGASPDGHALRVTYDLHPTGNIHVYLRLELARALAVREVELPRFAGDVRGRARDRRRDGWAWRSRPPSR